MNIIDKLIIRIGNANSGNWGHAGRIGMTGGSMPKGYVSSDIEKTLRNGKLSGESPKQGGAFPGGVYLVKGDGRAIVKGNNSDFHHDAINSELDAYELTKRLGWSGLVPETVTRKDMNGNLASAQKMIPGAKNAFASSPRLEDLSYQDLTRMALFDHITGNADRHGGNWIVDKNNRLYAIDNGLAFNSGTWSISDQMSRIQGSMDFFSVNLHSLSKSKGVSRSDVNAIKGMASDKTYMKRLKANYGTHTANEIHLRMLNIENSLASSNIPIVD